ncbi:MAG TPA: lysozyme inhibitor LprI family protein [Candidatus Eisenbacteria bacterium]|nr:lysozyme inhibitor LprI family protein [Candidatus Eisenbacteria bacterium]
MRSRVVCAILLATAALADAEPAAPVPTTAELQQKFETADAELERANAEAMGRIDCRADMPADVRRAWRSAMDRTQDAWRRYRDLDCKEGARYRGWGPGAGDRIARMSWECLEAATRARIAVVKEQTSQIRCAPRP